MCSPLLVLLAAAFFALGAGPGRAADRPNVVLILADDLGFSDLGCYGSEIATPHLDALASGGLRLTQFYNTGRCWPTRTSLLTGFYPQQVGRDSIPQLGYSGGGRGQRPGWAPILPKVLRTVGYRSYHVGKWHLDGEPVAEGFDRSYYMKDQHRFFSPAVRFLDDHPLPRVEPGTGFYATDSLGDYSVEFLQQHAAQHADAPFFLFLAFAAPHFPLHAKPEDIAKYEGRYDGGWEEIRAERWKRMADLGLAAERPSKVEPELGPPYHFPVDLEILGSDEVNRPVAWNSLTPAQKRFQATKMAIHAAMIDSMDQNVGRVLDQIRAMNAFEDTLVIFLSDNGASAEIMVRADGHDPSAPMGSAASHLCLGPGWSTAANTPFRKHKTWTHEGGIATPFIAHWPKGITARGELRSTPGHVIDFAPTVLEVAGVSPPRGAKPAHSLPGHSIVPVFAKDGNPLHDELWWCHDGHRALRVEDWKLVSVKGEEWELYDLATDRAETRNVAGEYPERVREMAAAWRSRGEELIAAAPPVKKTPSARDREKAQEVQSK